MQFSNVFALLAVVMTAAAAPSPVLDARTGGSPPPPAPQCAPTHPKVVCCKGLLNCLVSGILGSTCDGSSYCCHADAPVGVININLLNCVKVL